MAGDRPLPRPLYRGALFSICELLNDIGVDYAVTGSLATDPTRAEHSDIDIVVRPEDKEKIVKALHDAQLPGFYFEDWLIKTYIGSVLIDLLYDPSGITPQEAFNSADEKHLGTRINIASSEVSYKSYVAGKENNEGS
jgi:hypothetical protein